MPTSSVDSSKNSLLDGALHTLLVGTPRIPTEPFADFPSPLSKLFALSLCSLQLVMYVVGTVGGFLLWIIAQSQGWDDPLKGSLAGSIALEGWAAVGPIFGFIILLISRRWAMPAGVEWGWMGIRLGLLVFVVLFGMFLLGGLEPEVNISLIISICLFLPAMLFWRLGTRTINTINALTAEDFHVRKKHLLLEESQIFLSYRRGESQVWTDRIANDLKETFGHNAVFQDVEAIPPGVDFRQHLQAQLENCRVVLVVIGSDWVTATDEQGNPRLDQEQDWVRLEVEVALRRKIPLIPLLVDNSKMPSQNELPESIREFAFQNGLAIRPNPDFENDLNRLIQSLEEYVK